MTRRLVSGMLVLLLPTLASAQIPVIDATNYTANFTTSLQSVITAANSVISVANQALDLAPLDEIAVAGSIGEDIVLLSDTVATAGAVYTDVQSLQAQIAVLFDLSTAPEGTSALQERLLQIRQVKAEARIYAMRTQTLVATLIRTIGHISTLIGQVGMILGTVQGQQHLAQINTSINQTLVVLTVQNAAHQRTESLDAMEQMLVQTSLQKIREARMADWPR